VVVIEGDNFGDIGAAIKAIRAACPDGGTRCAQKVDPAAEPGGAELRPKHTEKRAASNSSLID
jgi:hypothetical protein